MESEFLIRLLQKFIKKFEMNNFKNIYLFTLIDLSIIFVHILKRKTDTITM